MRETLAPDLATGLDRLPTQNRGVQPRTGFLARLSIGTGKLCFRCSCLGSAKSRDGAMVHLLVLDVALTMSTIALNMRAKAGLLADVLVRQEIGSEGWSLPLNHARQEMNSHL